MFGPRQNQAAEWFPMYTPQLLQQQFEECDDDNSGPYALTSVDTTPIETVAFVGHEFKDPKMTAVIAKSFGIELSAGGEL